MENLFVFLATSLVLRATSPKFKRYRICAGASSLLHSSARTLHVRQTKEGDTLYFNEYETDGVTFGIVCVNMQEEVEEEQCESLLVHYLNRMRKPLHIQCNVSMEIGEENGQTVLTDYWQDATGTDWKVKGYTNGKVLAVLYVKNVSEAAVSSHDAYLDGFKFLPS